MLVCLQSSILDVCLGFFKSHFFLFKSQFKIDTNSLILVKGGLDKFLYVAQAGFESQQSFYYKHLLI